MEYLKHPPPKPRPLLLSVRRNPAPISFRPPYQHHSCHPLTTLSFSSIPILTSVIITTLHPSAHWHHVLPVSRDELYPYLLPLLLQPTSKPSQVEDFTWLDARLHSCTFILDLKQPDGRALRTKQQLWEGERATAPAEARHVLSRHRRRVKKSDLMRKQDIQLTQCGKHGLLSKKKEQNRMTPVIIIANTYGFICSVPDSM